MAWLLFNDCFLSIVSKDCARDELLVRARRPGDIEKVFPGVKVASNPRSDYLFRAVIKRSAAAAAMASELDRITYSNFKDSVPKDEEELHNAYLRVWSTMAELQSPRPYSGLSSVLFPLKANRGRAGGNARAVKLSPERRSEIARQAAKARWGKL